MHPPTCPYTFMYKLCAPSCCQLLVAKAIFHTLIAHHPALVIITMGKLIRTCTVCNIVSKVDGVATIATKITLFVMLIGHTTQFEAFQSQFFNQIWQIHCALQPAQVPRSPDSAIFAQRWQNQLLYPLHLHALGNKLHAYIEEEESLGTKLLKGYDIHT